MDLLRLAETTCLIILLVEGLDIMATTRVLLEIELKGISLMEGWERI